MSNNFVTDKDWNVAERRAQVRALMFWMPWRAGEGALGPVEMLAVLTTRHRRASPPSVAEQPRMSLQTRRDYHDFLTTPIIRQALTVVVPE